MSQFKVRLRPNWLPALNPPWFDLTDRLVVQAIPKLRTSIGRRENLGVMTYGDFSLTFWNADRKLDNLFNLALIQGTDPNTLRAPLLHLGAVYVADKEFSQTNWRNNFAFVDPRSVKIDRSAGTITLTAFSPAKLLERGNAERVHRFSSICQPSPYILFGFPLTTPATPVGGTAPLNAWWKLVGGAALKMYAGDRFNAVQPVAQVDYLEGMETVDLAGSEWVVKSAQVSGGDLLVEAYNDDGEPAQATFSGTQALMQHLTPWHHGLRYSQLIALLAAETNSALAAAGYTDALTVQVDSVDLVLSAPALALANQEGVVAPQTGAAWLDGAARVLALASGVTGVKKPDILLDAFSADRTFNNSTLDSGPTIAGAPSRHFPSPDLNVPKTYPAAAQQASAPLPDILRVPSVGQSLHQVNNLETDVQLKIQTYWCPVPSAFVSAPAALKTAYRIESYALQAVRNSAVPGADPFWRGRAGFTITQLTTTDLGTTWVVVSGQNSQTITTTSIDYPAPRVPFEAQGCIRCFPAGGQFLFIWTDGGRGDAWWYLSATENPTPAAMVAGATKFATLQGNRSAPLLGPSGGILYFADAGTFEYAPATGGTVTTTFGVNTVAGVGTSFNTEFAPGDIFVLPIPDGQTKQFGVVLSATALVLTLTAPWGGDSLSANPYYVRKVGSGVSMYWWNGAAMVLGAAPTLPTLIGADFPNALLDTARQRLQIVQGAVLQSFPVTFAAGTLTVTAPADIAVIDTPNYNPALDAIDGKNTGFTRVCAIAWLAGIVDVVQGTPPDVVNFPTGKQATLLVTTAAVYIFSDIFSGVIQVADFSEMSCSEAMKQLVQIPAQLIISGPDQDTTTDPNAYTPTPLVQIKARVPTGNFTVDLVSYSVTANQEPWLVQYSSIWVDNDKLPDLGTVRNDASFLFGGVLYKAAALRYGGTASLQITNRFVFTKSMAKLLANAAAYEFMIPRPSARLVVRDPFSVNGVTMVKVLQIAQYLASMPDYYAPAATGIGRIISVTYSLTDDLLELEIA